MFGSVEPVPSSRQLLAICGGLLLLTLAVYWPALSHDFVNYDDPDYVTSNTQVQAGLNWPNIIWAFTTGRASNWHPLTWISHMLDAQVYGLKPAGHHFTNVLFHAANTLLLFWLLFKITGSVWPSAFVAALFAWHPVHVESVAWVSERKDVLSAFFWLLTTWAYYQYCVVFTQSRTAKTVTFYLLTLVLFALGLLCKPMLVTLPFTLLLLDLWPLQRIKLTKRKKQPSHLKLFWRLILEKVPLLVLAGVSSWITFAMQRKGGAVTSLDVLPVRARLTNALVSYLRYVGKIVWPQHLAVLYPFPGAWPILLIAASVIFLIVVSVGAILLKTKPYIFVGWFWFLGTLVPVIGLVQVGMQSMADRYTYIPAIGLFIIIAWGVPDLLGRVPQSKAVLAAGASAALVICLILTFSQIKYWRNGETLFSHTVEVTENNYLAYNNLGFYRYEHGHPDEAMIDYEKSIAINPNYSDAQNNVGHALMAKGRNADAIPYLEKALNINPALVEAHNNLGNALSNQGKLDDAIAHYLTALHYRPDDEDAHNNLGIALAMQGRLDEAVTLLTEAVHLKPSDAGAHGNLGNAFAVQHKWNEAETQFKIALQLNPNDAQARNNLGNILTEQGRLDEARENYLTALKLNPDNPEVNFNFGLVLLRLGKTDEARSHFLEALRLKPDYTAARQQLESIGAARKP